MEIKIGNNDLANDGSLVWKSWNFFNEKLVIQYFYACHGLEIWFGSKVIRFY